MGGYETFTNSLGEKDTCYNPYKVNPSEYTQDDYNRDRESDANAYVGRSEKNLEKFSTDKLIELYKKNWYFVDDCESTDYLHDIRHDGDYDMYLTEMRRYKDALATLPKIMSILAARPEDEEAIRAAGLGKVYDEYIEKTAAEEQRKADWKAKMQAEEDEIANRVAEDPLAALLYAIDKLIAAEKKASKKSIHKQNAGLNIATEYDTAEDYVVQYLDERFHIVDSKTGLFYEKKSWGYLKRFLDYKYWKSMSGGCYKEIMYYGKTLKAMWVHQFK